ncbi:hypothetical protein RUESEDTHA_03299 [Ruegeria sp. THAF57]|uniref:hypothetical protein n=1 Tax=Ruegeria sp. THAF57 TaxID=2744555 RepID=UPI0015DE83BC|nr:hypothetical protein [Ruegeria sp. THAF57]CAD0186391.1 hypothetical protein RUESEDTHA_03299 [Ruegeria sp. THAF57]
MKVTRNTPNQLILSNRPWLIGVMLVFFILCFVGAGLTMISEGNWSGILVALFGGGMGFGAFCIFVRRVQVILDRSTDSILIRRQSIFGYETVRHVLSNLSHAEVETTTSNGNNGSSTTHRPVLILGQGMSAGRHPIVSAYVSGHGSHRLVDAVNDWLPARAVDSDNQSA